MAEVGIRELKTHLSAYLRKVKEGEIVTITDRGKPVGRIMPISTSNYDQMMAMVDAGLARWNGKKFQPREPSAVNKGDRMISDLIVEDRRR